MLMNKKTDYNHQELESRWQAAWENEPGHPAEDFSDKPKFYGLVEFPYPSGEGLHLGHAFTNTILDILARKKMLSGFNVLYPMGWDAFGLPTENYAIKTGIQPAAATKKNTDRFKAQMKKLALAYDWNREINTTDPSYYRWTQWIFLKLFENGLAYKSEAPVGWCPSCKIILANEEIVDGNCERCGTPSEQRLQKQWMLKITAYADRLADELDLVDYPTSAKVAQRNWIGKNQGAVVSFATANEQLTTKDIKVFTTRIDTIFGVTFIVLAPEHPLAQEIASTNQSVANYIAQATKKSERERKESAREKTGVDTQLTAINPIDDSQVPVWISDFVLADYGTGAIMGVPAHDDRDREFAQKFNLPIKDVIQDNTLINSGKYTGISCKEAPAILIKDLDDRATSQTVYHLRDWIFSRQHYWGEPIPIVNCPTCGLVAIPEDQLPLELPQIEKYQPTETGESPLANVHDWVNTTCPSCGGPAKRETDTMPNWAGSSWYYLRYCDPRNSTSLGDLKTLKYWMPVDLYLGGAEHTTLHLLYSRFWHKFLNDIGVVPEKEPYMARRQHGIILAEDGTKMSKSKGNVINPDDMIEKYGCDTLRTYLAFMGPYDQTMPWSMKGIEGSRRFIKRIWNIFQEETKFSVTTTPELASLINKTIIKVGSDIDNLKHNTAVAALMIFLKEWEKPNTSISKADAQKFLISLSPIAPHIAEELWHQITDSQTSVHQQTWPTVEIDDQNENVTLAVMVNGKYRSTVTVSKSVAMNNQQQIETLAQADDKVTKHITSPVKKVIFVPGKAINFVI